MRLYYVFEIKKLKNVSVIINDVIIIADVHLNDDGNFNCISFEYIIDQCNHSMYIGAKSLPSYVIYPLSDMVFTLIKNKPYIPYVSVVL